MFRVLKNSNPITVTDDVAAALLTWRRSGFTAVASYSTDRLHSERWHVWQHCLQLHGYSHLLVRQHLHTGEHQQPSDPQLGLSPQLKTAAEQPHE